MAIDWQIDRENDTILIGLAIDNAVLDIKTNEKLLMNLANAFEKTTLGTESIPIGWFGEFPIRVNLGKEDSVSVFVDGPQFCVRRTQSSAIWIDKGELQKIVMSVLAGT
jgi:hypothetical protein